MTSSNRARHSGFPGVSNLKKKYNVDWTINRVREYIQRIFKEAAGATTLRTIDDTMLKIESSAEIIDKKFNSQNKLI